MGTGDFIDLSGPARLTATGTERSRIRGTFQGVTGPKSTLVSID